MINSESRNDAKGSVRQAAFNPKNKNKLLKVPPELGNLKDRDLDPVIDKLLEKHKPLEGFIFRDKYLGVKLQNIDSMIVERVLLYFAVERNIPVLPMHDSFRIDGRVYDELEEVMQKVIITNFRRPIRISNDDYLPLMHRLFGMVDKQIEDGDYDVEAFAELVIDLQASIERMQSGLKGLEELRKQKAGN